MHADQRLPTSIAERVRIIDLEHLGTPMAIGAAIVDERYLIDPGPVICVERLLEQLGAWQPQAILLSHIHLDHAGATGYLVKRWPKVKVWAHPRALPHLVDPSRLVHSAAGVYGDQLARLWGLPEPVPRSAISSAEDGASIGPFEVAETPGHASHHLSFLDRSSCVAFVGDVAGVRIPPARTALVPTVPPEFDPEQWRSSLDWLASWKPAALVLTHYGITTAVAEQLEAVRAELEALVRTGGQQDRVAAHVDELLSEPEVAPLARSYRQAAQPQTFAAGIASYLRKANKEAMA